MSTAEELGTFSGNIHSTRDSRERERERHRFGSLRLQRFVLLKQLFHRAQSRASLPLLFLFLLPPSSPLGTLHSPHLPRTTAVTQRICWRRAAPRHAKTLSRMLARCLRWFRLNESSQIQRARRQFFLILRGHLNEMERLCSIEWYLIIIHVQIQCKSDV